MQKVISFIIPSYNAEPYLDQCLKSFLHPDCMEQIEVLIVNDGSKDGTKALAERYMEDYPDIFRLIDKENGGHGSAINVGVKKASGRYLKVMMRMIGSGQRICQYFWLIWKRAVRMWY